MVEMSTKLQHALLAASRFQCIDLAALQSQDGVTSRKVLKCTLASQNLNRLQGYFQIIYQNNTSSRLQVV